MKIVIVTGSSRGIGASTPLACARHAMGNKAVAINAQNIEVAGGYII